MVPAWLYTSTSPQAGDDNGIAATCHVGKSGPLRLAACFVFTCAVWSHIRQAVTTHSPLFPTLAP